MVHILQRKWKQNIDKCLRYCVQEFLTNPQFKHILQDMTLLLNENKVIEAYTYCTNTSEYFRIKSKASLFLEVRELLEPISLQFRDKRWNKQLFNICSWFDITKNPDDIISCLTGLISSDIQTTHPNMVSQYALQSNSSMVKGLALHDKYAVPIAKRILKYLTNNHQKYEVWEPGRIIHPTMYFMACTPDVIISHRKKEFYRMMDALHAQHQLSPGELSNNALQAVFELKTFHKAQISKQDMNHILDMIEIGYDGVKKQLVKIITDLAVKQKILPTSKTREIDFRHRLQANTLDGFSKTFILYPTDEFLMLNMKSVPANQLGFIPKSYKKYEWSMENLCSKSTIGRAWVFLYDPNNVEESEPLHVFSYEKSPFMLLPKSKVYRQMLEQRCVLQHYNSDAVSLFIGMFCIQDGDTNSQWSYAKSNASPGIILIIEATMHTETTMAFEECALIELNERCPQALGAKNPLPLCELTDIIHSLVWSRQLERETSYGLGNYNPETDVAEYVLKDSFL